MVGDMVGNGEAKCLWLALEGCTRVVWDLSLVGKVAIAIGGPLREWPNCSSRGYQMMFWRHHNELLSVGR